MGSPAGVDGFLMHVAFMPVLDAEEVLNPPYTHNCAVFHG